MPLIPNFIERLLIFRLNQGPGPLLDMWSAVGFRIVLAAIRLGVFEALSGGPLSAGELARRVDADPHGSATMLEALEPLGYVRRQGERYANTPMTTKWLLKDSHANFAPFMRAWGTFLPDLWGNLEESIRSGKSPRNLYEWIEHRPETSRDFQMGMIAIARFTADEIIGKVPLPATAARVLDVGGGHAMYSIALCRKHPGVSVTVFDSPQALNTARENVSQAKLADRITLQEGDFRRDGLGADYDVALLFNIIHGFTPEENIDLFRKVGKALKPGGRIVILEQLSGGSSLPMIRAVSRILGVSYFHVLDGQTYSYDDVAHWLTAAGFARVRRIDPLRAPGNSLVLGVAP